MIFLDNENYTDESYLPLKKSVNGILPLSFKKTICILILALLKNGFRTVTLLQVELPRGLLKMLMPASYLQRFWLNWSREKPGHF